MKMKKHNIIFFAVMAPIAAAVAILHNMSLPVAWFLPATISVLSFLAARAVTKDMHFYHSIDRLPDQFALVRVIFYLVAAVFALITWLVWAVAK